MNRAVVGCRIPISIASSNRIFFFFSPLQSLYSQNLKQQPFHSSNNNNTTTPFGSPTRVQKLIASQSDPLLAKEIFDLASRQPNFRHTYSTYLILILKLGRYKHFSFIDQLLRRLKSESYPITPTLFSYLINVYAEADLPDKALKTFYTILHFNSKPLTKHLNRILEVLVSHRNYIRPAFDLFKDAHTYGVEPDTKSYNILMRAFCLNGDISIAYNLFNKMFKRDVVPDIESYRILMQALCRKSQVNGAVDLLEDMLNKGFVPDSLTYTTLLNSLCRKNKLREAYKLLCRMKVKGCNPDIVHYNTVILGFCREGRAHDACKVISDMMANGCLPNLVSYRTLVSGLCDLGMLDVAKKYVDEMMAKGFSPHFGVVHALVKGFCNFGRVEDACGVLTKSLEHGEAPHEDTWMVILPLICEVDDCVKISEALEEVLKIEIKGHTRIVDAGIGLENYLINKIRAKSESMVCQSEETGESRGSGYVTMASINSAKNAIAALDGLLFPALADKERAKSCLTELTVSSNAFKQALNAGIEQLVAIITPQIRPVLDSVGTISYELSEAEYADNEVNDPWVQRLLHAVETNVAWLQPLVTANNYDTVHLVSDFIVKRLEIIMMHKRFSQVVFSLTEMLELW